MKAIIPILEILLFILYVTFGYTQDDNFPVLKGPYLGQKPPGITPKIYAPGIISTADNNEFCASFSPDGREFYFNRGMTIMVCNLQKKGWTAPEPASFNGNYRNHEAHLAFDNKRIFFGSSRPPHPYGIWLTERNESGWSEPRRMWDGMYVTTAKNGNIYFGVEFPNPAHIVMTKFSDTGNVSFSRQKIKFADTHPKDKSIFHPAIAPDESFIIFDDNKELFVSFRKADESWSISISLSNVLKDRTGTMPSVSPDGKYLFYAFRNDLYWVDTKILGIIRPEE